MSGSSIDILTGEKGGGTWFSMTMVVSQVAFLGFNLLQFS